MNEVTDWWQMQHSDAFWTPWNREKQEVDAIFPRAPIISNRPRHHPLPVRYCSISRALKTFRPSH
jgi:hypothetical protein